MTKQPESCNTFRCASGNNPSFQPPTRRNKTRAHKILEPMFWLVLMHIRPGLVTLVAEDESEFCDKRFIVLLALLEFEGTTLDSWLFQGAEGPSGRP